MKITNFRDLVITGQSIVDRRLHATVDIETGLFIKKKRTSQICRALSGFWYFTESGEITPSFECEKLERSYLAQHPEFSIWARP